jgi:hypothetical protein
MKRAAIFIGVDKTGGLPVLKDAAKGAKRLAEEWAKEQPISKRKVLTDEKKPVTAGMIKAAVRDILKPGNVEQLFIYFAGHGVNIHRREYWLLSDADNDPQEAVNVTGSEDLARYCGIPHIVFISDACRTAATTLRAQSITGSEMFPIRQGARRPVDQFFACALGAPSNEIPDAETTAREFKAAYTGELIPALSGKVPSLVEWVVENGKNVGYIRPWPLDSHLKTAMAMRLADPKLKSRVIQVPDALVVSGPTAWVSRVKGPGPSTAGGLALGERRQGQGPAPFTSTPLIGTALNSPQKLEKSIIAAAKPFGPMHQESRCGFKIRGAMIVDAFAIGGRTEMTNRPADVVRVWDVKGTGANTLLLLDDGSAIVLPAIPNFLASLTVEAGDLVDVAYEPSEFTSRWNDYRNHAQELRTLRTVVATATREGSFRLQGEDALKLARRMQYTKGIDPALAIYAAYAYHDLHQFNYLEEMQGYMRRDLGATFFDVAMLSRELDNTKYATRKKVLSPIPLLSQGWVYLNARRIGLPNAFAGLQGMLQDSVWTKFGPLGTERLKLAFKQGGFR